ncbi:SubName: Full=Uncharacterized protein {ECO:0000313/EMBL:CCA67717.1} [Serendipita indica DSM 11827]|uniref:ATP11-domain-containing protein n=1 Tax=Serendipita indica (strain DSM 11827) TaxID=1109443 RepID=G4T8S5_SERID|nr:SubName: Full=Uncharacterized protein {ECO:0000313/EMBL:CCA67717.1} [Serendipita indica DSM 11827]CCA67717.1 hypothetical protein PIIN_01544 [Serendipita indica DSM 11827]
MQRLRLIPRPTVLRFNWNVRPIRLQSTYQERYAEKLKQKLDELGLKDIEEYRSKTKESVDVKPVEPLEAFPKGPTSKKASPNPRKDSSPVTPLSDIMDLGRILQTPHTSEQIGALWTTYHTAKATQGKGFLSAVIPRETYESFLPAAKKYPSFILPVPRPEAQVELKEGEESHRTPYEFFYMEWGHHSAPPVPNSDPFANAKPPQHSPNPPCTTVIFTPLQEYKLRQAYALPHLVLTHYTDLAQSHGLVLMRGELTASTNDPGRFLMTPSTAQLLAFGLQQYYLPKSDNRHAKLLTTFHENPEQFSWEELISASQL